MKHVNLRLRMPKKLYKQTKKEAKENGVSMNTYILMKLGSVVDIANLSDEVYREIIERGLKALISKE